MQLIFDKICESLTTIEDNLNKLKTRVVSTDKDYHIGEIYTNIERIRYHLLQIKVPKEIDNTVTEKTMTKEQNNRKSCGDIPAEVIENKLEVPKVEINFRDRKMRKASSWKYLAKWESILEEQWFQQNQNKNVYDFTGINLIVPKRNQSVRTNKHNISSTKEDFLDEKCMKKSNSTECILDRDDDNNCNTYNSLEKKCVSENDINRNSLHLTYADDIYNCDYLLSLRDLEGIGKIEDPSTENTETVQKDISKSVNEVRTNNKTVSLHKPRIVGVIYKMRL